MSHSHCLSAWMLTLYALGRGLDHSNTASHTPMPLCGCPHAGSSDGAVRLVGGRASSMGLVQICHDGVWGTVRGHGL